MINQGDVRSEGITIYCTRIGSGTRFVPFDTVYDLPTHCFFKIKNKGRVFNVPHGVQQQQIIHQNPKKGKRKLDELPPTTAPTNNLSSQISPTPLVPPADCPNVISNTSRPDTPPDNVEFEKELQEFYDSLMAATTGFTSSPKKIEELEKKDDKNVPI
ncbi:unnamed protein product [Meloidogyne enterolobii]|uniref:Uncharacterized protein n=1 Tax=Meloidogyne enterolobii TaxID=390850 RepID=A0ACB0XNR6_MELEN